MLLSIESSCDDSALALTDIATKKLIFHKRISQVTHTKYGGVVPEIAAREHAIALPYLLEQIKEYFCDIKAIGVTNTPGLGITLLEGVMMAKSLSVSLDIPIIAINHLYGHIYSLFIEKEAILPQITLLVSGGHTAIFEVFDIDNINLLGSSLDDSIGESFDKVSKMLGLGYPGGSIIEELSLQGDENRFLFPRALAGSVDISFSYSGLKNAVRLQIQKSKNNNSLEKDKADICASFQKMATLHLIDKVSLCLKTTNIDNFSIVGGVSINKYIRSKLSDVCIKYNKKLFLTSPQFCSDNAAMIGRVALEMYHKKQFTHHSKLKAIPRFL